MAKCEICGTDFGLFEGSKGKCNPCKTSNRTKEQWEAENASDQDAIDAANRKREAAAAALEALKARARKLILTTEGAPLGLTVTERLGIVTAECAFGMHIFKDIFTIARDAFGGRSAAIQNTLKDARNTALEELRMEAATLGANAVIAVDLDYSEFSGAGKSMLFLVASGTAVKLGPAP